VGLHHSCAVIDINYKAGESVALAMNEAEGIGQLAIALCPLWKNAFAGFVGGAKALLPKVLIYDNVLKREHTHCDATYLNVAYGKETAIGADYAHYITFFGAAVYMVDGAREYPGMETPE
jgi:hypothetical protein